MRNVTAAAKVLVGFTYSYLLEEIAATADERVREVLAVQFVADVGCGQCGGDGGYPVQRSRSVAEHHPGCEGMCRDGMCPIEVEVDDSYLERCPAVHVEIPNLYDGSTVFADPDKVLGWCIIHDNKQDAVSVRLGIGPICHAGGLTIEDHCEFRWVPRPLGPNLDSDTETQVSGREASDG